MDKNSFSLKGKAALVTGGNGGIGLGMARGLAGCEADLVIVGRKADKTAAAACAALAAEFGVKAVGVEADVSRETDCTNAVAAAVKAFGRLDIVINNAGINNRKAPQEYSAEEFRHIVDVNLTSAFLMSKAAYPELKKAGGGKIVNIGSMTSIFGVPFAAAYASSKGAVVQLTKCLAIAWAADRIQVNAVLPGWIETELTDNARKQVPGLYERVLSRTPAGRWGRPDDLAGAAIFLCSPAADFITGVSLPVDGGYSVM
jgi:2-deoxy-D-gluconate 3-dehydrogenase